MERAPQLTVFAIQHVADGATAGFVHFGFSLAGFDVKVALAGGVFGLRFAARGTAIGKAGLIRPQFELFRADDAGFDRKRHT